MENRRRRGLSERLGAGLGAGALVMGMASTLGAGPAWARAVGPPPTPVSCPPGSNLQDAINAASQGSTIFVSGTCTGNFTIDKNLTLVGSASVRARGGPATLDGGGSGTVLTISSGATVHLTSLTIQNGSADERGGGIDNENGGSVYLTSSKVTGNNAPGGAGGGIFNGGGLFLNSSKVSGNSAAAGGGIYNDLGSVVLTSSTVSGNSAPYGGGIVDGGAVQLYSSTVSGNLATTGNGGGIYSIRGANLILNSSKVIANNAPAGQGGGIYNAGGVTLNSSMVSGNSAVVGGGIFNAGGSVTLTSSKVNGNTPSSNQCFGC